MKVSVITINRNNRAGLAATIKSLAGQSQTSFEFIVIDGNSDDGSKDLIEKYRSMITYSVSEPDNGIYAAMNKGISAAKGEYLLFLNSGDCLYDSGVLEEFYTNQYKEDVVYGDIVFGKADGQRLNMPDSISISTFTGASIGHGAAFIKRALFEKYGLYNEQNKIVSDWEFFLKVFLKHECSYKHVHRIFTVYQEGGVSVNPAHYQLQAIERDRAFQSVLPQYYEMIAENDQLKKRLAAYEQSRVFQFLKKLKDGRINQLKNRFLRSGKR